MRPAEATGFQDLESIIGADRLIRIEGEAVFVPPADDLHVLPCPGDELQPEASADGAGDHAAGAAPHMIYGDHIEAFGLNEPSPFFARAGILLATDYIGRAALRPDAFNRSELPARFRRRRSLAAVA
jgi:hypothetical protein